MSTNISTGPDQFAQPPTQAAFSAPQQSTPYNTRRAGEVYIPPSSLEDAQRERSEYQRNIKLWLLLLIIICLAGLGSITVVNTPPAHKTTPVTSFTNGACTATSQTINYLADNHPMKDDPKVLQAWSQASRTNTDLANVKACAAAFVDAYQTFDANKPQTFETCTSMLSIAAKQRFYGANGQQADNHIDPMRRASFQKQGLQQSAQATQPMLLNISHTNGRVLAWLVVPYHLSSQMAGGNSLVQNNTITVLLVSTQVDAQSTGTGWQVVAWQNGDQQFDPPTTL